MTANGSALPDASLCAEAAAAAAAIVGIPRSIRFAAGGSSLTLC